MTARYQATASATVIVADVAKGGFMVTLPPVAGLAGKCDGSAWQII